MNLYEIFINFLKNHGLLPTQITRFLQSNPGFKPDIHFIADMLYSRDNFDPTIHNTSINTDQLLEILKHKPFESDAGLSVWLKEISAILTILKSKEIFDNIETPKEQIEWAMKTVIQSCPFVDESVKENYISKISQSGFNNTHLKNKYILRNQTNRAEFEAFLKMNNKKGPTIQVYVSAINQINNNYQPGLWDITQATEVHDVMKELFTNPTFCAENQHKNNSLSCAMKQYATFLATKNEIYYPQPDISTHKRQKVTKDPDVNLVAFCFSCGHKLLYPNLNQTEALDEAAKTLEMSKASLSNIRDSFDFYNPYSSRNGWDKAITPEIKDVLDEYLINVGGDEYLKNNEGLHEAVNKAKQILKLN